MCIKCGEEPCVQYYRDEIAGNEALIELLQEGNTQLEKEMCELENQFTLKAIQLANRDRKIKDLTEKLRLERGKVNWLAEELENYDRALVHGSGMEERKEDWIRKATTHAEKK